VPTDTEKLGSGYGPEQPRQSLESAEKLGALGRSGQGGCGHVLGNGLVDDTHDAFGGWADGTQCVKERCHRCLHISCRSEWVVTRTELETMMRVACIVGGADSGDLAGSRCSAPSPSSSVYHADDERSRVRAVRVAIVQE